MVYISVRRVYVCPYEYVCMHLYIAGLCACVSLNAHAFMHCTYVLCRDVVAGFPARRKLELPSGLQLYFPCSATCIGRSQLHRICLSRGRPCARDVGGSRVMGASKLKSHGPEWGQAFSGSDATAKSTAWVNNLKTLTPRQALEQQLRGVPSPRLPQGSPLVGQANPLMGTLGPRNEEEEDQTSGLGDSPRVDS